ncbi:uncharacterized protein LOC133373731 isoform X4 [Rhineura floridana]|uniref:uncharacterized protein LOC133373731 isoform X4 n=1 Tax=Rhineura floridana TaxID=261503 RepID=UPI002AC8414B|nr:uncharacterized protein LOC133373731 isoform X4 [Rhineura floridana]
MADGVLSAGVNLEAFAQAIAAIQALRSSVTRVFDCLKDGKRHKEALEGREKSFVSSFQESLHSVSRDLGELERLSNLVGKPSENHPLHNSGLLSLDPVQDKTPLYSQLLQAYKWSNKTLTLDWPWLLPWLPSSVLLLGSLWSPHVPPLHVMFPLHVNLETPDSTDEGEWETSDPGEGTRGSSRHFTLRLRGRDQQRGSSRPTPLRQGAGPCWSHPIRFRERPGNYSNPSREEMPTNVGTMEAVG